MQQYSDINHTGVLGMKWGHRKNYSSTGLKSYIAKKQNEKVDKSFKKWQENDAKKATAIDLGKKTNIARINYEKNSGDKTIKSELHNANKDYKKALGKNTTYRKGSIKEEVGKDMSRKYLSEAKNVAKLLKADPSNSGLQKKYNDLMSKHDVERASARRAQEVAAKRSQKKANIKRTMTITVKAATATAVVAAGTVVVNRYLSNHDVTVNGKSVRMSGKDIANATKIINFAKEAKQYF